MIIRQPRGRPEPRLPAVPPGRPRGRDRRGGQSHQRHPDRATLNLFDTFLSTWSSCSLTAARWVDECLRGAVIGGGRAPSPSSTAPSPRRFPPAATPVTIQPLPGRCHRITEFAKAAVVAQYHSPTARNARRRPMSHPRPPAPSKNPAAGAYPNSHPGGLHPVSACRRSARSRPYAPTWVDDRRTSISLLANSQISATATLAGLEQVNYAEPPPALVSRSWNSSSQLIAATSPAPECALCRHRRHRLHPERLCRHHVLRPWRGQRRPSTPCRPRSCAIYGQGRRRCREHERRLPRHRRSTPSPMNRPQSRRQPRPLRADQSRCRARNSTPRAMWT